MQEKILCSRTFGWRHIFRSKARVMPIPLWPWSPLWFMRSPTFDLWEVPLHADNLALADRTCPIFRTMRPGSMRWTACCHLFPLWLFNHLFFALPLCPLLFCFFFLILFYCLGRTSYFSLLIHISIFSQIFTCFEINILTICLVFVLVSEFIAICPTRRLILLIKAEGGIVKIS